MKAMRWILTGAVVVSLCSPLRPCREASRCVIRLTPRKDRISRRFGAFARFPLYSGEPSLFAAPPAFGAASHLTT